MTRLSRLHPYPGMIADELAIRVSKLYVRRGHRVLDPFCGTGRTLIAASEFGAESVGVDANPLSHLLVRAKAAQCDLRILESTALEMEKGHLNIGHHDYEFESGRKVDWFSIRAKRELSWIISSLNRQLLGESELYILACILSATAREVSYCRNGQWKIHRISPAQRSTFKKSAFKVFSKRLRRVIGELSATTPLTGTCSAYLGDSRFLNEVLAKEGQREPFDLIFTSPPYGDSRTTVQYGGVSSLCLDVVKHLKGLNLPAFRGKTIDHCCLGGSLTTHCSVPPSEIARLGDFWSGEDKNPARKRVISYLGDLAESCRRIVSVMNPCGIAVFVVARRTVGGSQLKLDRYVVSLMEGLGCACKKVEKRRIRGKLTPYVIHARGNSNDRKIDDHCLVPTMREEYVLHFRKYGPEGS